MRDILALRPDRPIARRHENEKPNFRRLPMMDSSCLPLDYFLFFRCFLAG
jgi:hypothetical protein